MAPSLFAAPVYISLSGILLKCAFVEVDIYIETKLRVRLSSSIIIESTGAIESGVRRGQSGQAARGSPSRAPSWCVLKGLFHCISWWWCPGQETCMYVDVRVNLWRSSCIWYSIPTIALLRHTTCTVWSKRPNRHDSLWAPLCVEHKTTTQGVDKLSHNYAFIYAPMRQGNTMCGVRKSPRWAPLFKTTSVLERNSLMYNC